MRVPVFPVSIEYAAAHPFLGLALRSVPFDSLNAVRNEFQRQLGDAYMLSVYFRLLQARFGSDLGERVRARRQQYADMYLGDAAKKVLDMTLFVEREQLHAQESSYAVRQEAGTFLTSEHFLSVVALIFAPGAPYANQQDSENPAIPHDQTEEMAKLLIHARRQASNGFEPLVEFMAIRNITKSPTNWSDSELRDGQTLLAGQYERHLRRRLRNPLFPLLSQEVNPKELSQARYCDRTLMMRERHTVWQLLGEITSKVGRTQIELTEQETKVLHALQRVYEVGGNLSDEQLSLEWILELVRAENRGVSNARTPTGHPYLADHVARGPWAARQFAAQLLSENSPIVAGEVAAALFCERPETIKWCTDELFPSGHSRDRLLDEVEGVCRRILVTYGNLSRYRRHLRAFGIGWWSTLRLRIRFTILTMSTRRSIARLISAMNSSSGSH